MSDREYAACILIVAAYIAVLIRWVIFPAKLSIVKTDRCQMCGAPRGCHYHWCTLFNHDDGGDDAA